MIRIRPYMSSDAEQIISWCRSEREYYQWTAGALGAFPVTKAGFARLNERIQFTALDETEIVGYFTMRSPKPTPDELRLGFVIVRPDRRGTGCAGTMLRLGIRFAFELYGARRLSLGVFENNPAAYRCYRSAGFSDVTPETPVIYTIQGEPWTVREMTLEKTACHAPGASI